MLFVKDSFFVKLAHFIVLGNIVHNYSETVYSFVVYIYSFVTFVLKFFLLIGSFFFFLYRTSLLNSFFYIYYFARYPKHQLLVGSDYDIQGKLYRR